MPIFVLGGGSSGIADTGTIGITGMKLITMALRLIQVCGATSTPSPEDAQLGLDILNQFIDDLRTHDAASPGLLRSQYPLTAGTSPYTIGDGGDFDQGWPEDIELASIYPNRADDPLNELPIAVVPTWDAFQGICQKAGTSAYPTAIFYDRNCVAGLGQVHVYPVPTIDDADLILYTPNMLGLFSTLTTRYQFKPGYVRMLRYNLAVELAPEFLVEAPDTVKRLASSSLANIKRANFRPKPAVLDGSMPGMGRGRGFNVWTGE